MLTTVERVEKFNNENKPFRIYDFNNGKYSLGLPVDFLDGPYEGYRQEAFDQYAKSIGEAANTFGSGYDWEKVFQTVFEQEQELQEIDFDSEAGGFYCNCNKFEVLESLGKRFREMCEDKERFNQLVVESLAASYQEDFYHVDNKTVKYYLQDITRAKIEIKTKNHHLILENGQGQEVWKGKNVEVHEKNKNSLVRIVARVLLHLKVNYIQYDMDNNHVSMKATETDDGELVLSQSIEEPVIGMNM